MYNECHIFVLGQVDSGKWSKYSCEIDKLQRILLWYQCPIKLYQKEKRQHFGCLVMYLQIYDTDLGRYSQNFNNNTR
jgi:hypothetical protein